MFWPIGALASYELVNGVLWVTCCGVLFALCFMFGVVLYVVRREDFDPPASIPLASIPFASLASLFFGPRCLYVLVHAWWLP